MDVSFVQFFILTIEQVKKFHFFSNRIPERFLINKYGIMGFLCEISNYKV